MGRHYPSLPILPHPSSSNIVDTVRQQIRYYLLLLRPFSRSMDIQSFISCGARSAISGDLSYGNDWDNIITRHQGPVWVCSVWGQQSIIILKAGKLKYIVGFTSTGCTELHLMQQQQQFLCDCNNNINGAIYQVPVEWMTHCFTLLFAVAVLVVVVA